MSYALDQDGPAEAARPFDIAAEECSQQLGKLGALIHEVEQRIVRFRLSVPHPQGEDKAVQPARDLHSPAVDRLINMRDDIQALQRRLAVLLEELEV